MHNVNKNHLNKFTNLTYQGPFREYSRVHPAGAPYHSIGSLAGKTHGI